MKSTREGKGSKKERIKLKKSKLVEKQTFVQSPEVDQISADSEFLKKDNSTIGKVEKKKNKSLGRKKRKKKENEAVVDEIDQLGSEEDNSIMRKVEKKKNKSLRRKKRKKENGAVAEEIDQLGYEDGGMEGTSHAAESSQFETKGKIENFGGPQEADVGANTRTHKSKRAGKKKKKDLLSSMKGSELMEKGNEVVENEIYQISSGDEDCSKGMKKWISEYYQQRPGLKILQERIDEFITTHEAQEEQARKEREARAAEGGWTVVVHHKGRKKTTDSESGITMGSVAQAAVVDKMAKKKSKDIGPNFYRFQKREAQRNEIMMLQSKFEQDRKRIQQLRAARKFRPY